MALHRYFLWADQMRELYYGPLTDPRVAAGDPKAVEVIFQKPFMSYWYAGSYAVIEGWEELLLHDTEIDEMLKSEDVHRLRRYQ